MFQIGFFGICKCLAYSGCTYISQLSVLQFTYKVHQSDSYTPTYIAVLLQFLFHYGLLRVTEWSSLHYTGRSLLFIYFIRNSVYWMVHLFPINLQSLLGQRWRNLSLDLIDVSVVYFLLPVPISHDFKYHNFIISLDIF